jgi:hypothetical protein
MPVTRSYGLLRRLRVANKSSPLSRGTPPLQKRQTNKVEKDAKLTGEIKAVICKYDNAYLKISNKLATSKTSLLQSKTQLLYTQKELHSNKELLNTKNDLLQAKNQLLGREHELVIEQRDLITASDRSIKHLKELLNEKDLLLTEKNTLLEHQDLLQQQVCTAHIATTKLLEAQVTDLGEEVEIEQKTVLQTAIYLDKVQSKIDELVVAGIASGADAATLNAIKFRPVI